MKLNPSAVSWREVDGEILALDLAASRYISTNEAGALLWRSLADGASRDDLIDALLAEFDVDRARAGEDVDTFLTALAAGGLLSR